MHLLNARIIFPRVSWRRFQLKPKKRERKGGHGLASPSPLMGMIMDLGIVPRMRMIMGAVISIVHVVVYMAVMAVFVIMYVLVQMIMRMHVGVFVRMRHISVGVLMGMTMRVFMTVNVFVFMCSFHGTEPPFMGFVKTSCPF